MVVNNNGENRHGTAERNIYIKYGNYIINIINNKIMLLVKMQ